MVDARCEGAPVVDGRGRTGCEGAPVVEGRGRTGAGKEGERGHAEG